MSQICKLANVATKTLNKTVAAIVSAAALEQYATITELIKNYTCIDINQLFECIAFLAVLCWVGQWLNELVKFVLVVIPKFFKNLCAGKFSLCLLDCNNQSESSTQSQSQSESESESKKSDDSEYCDQSKKSKKSKKSKQESTQY